MKNVVMGTAGHVDHGKTSLIKAMTGIDCDRLAEEKKREITIDIGFANIDLSEDNVIGIVDVPGHERFIKNMLAGVSGIDFVLMVIAADDGVMPQTLEHLDICQLLGIKRGIIAITKKDLVDEEWIELLCGEIKQSVKDTFLESAPICPVSVNDGISVRNLKEEIIKLANETEARNEWGGLRFPVDRVFTMKGAGTVVTGTLVSGTFHLNQELVILPDNREVRVRQLQIHGRSTERAGAGRRIAVNLTGVDVDEVKRGNVVAETGTLTVANLLDVKLKVLKRIRRPVKNRSRIRFYIGTQEIIGRISILDKVIIEPGDEAYARIRLESEVVCNFRDNFIFRDFPGKITLGGGIVLETEPSLKGKKSDICGSLKMKEKGTPEEIVLQCIEDSGYKLSSEDGILSKTNLESEKGSVIIKRLIQDGLAVKFESDGSYISRRYFEKLKSDSIQMMKKYFEENKRKTWVSIPEIRSKYFKSIDKKLFNYVMEDLINESSVARSLSGSGYRHSEGSEGVFAEEERIRDKIQAIYLEKEFNGPDEDGLMDYVDSKLVEAKEILQVLVDAGVILKLGAHAFAHSDIVEAAKLKIIALLKEKGEINIADVRSELNTSRKFAVPLMEYFDSKNITMRKGDVRVIYKAG